MQRLLVRVDCINWCRSTQHISRIEDLGRGGLGVAHDLIIAFERFRLWNWPEEIDPGLVVLSSRSSIEFAQIFLAARRVRLHISMCAGIVHVAFTNTLVCGVTEIL